MTRKLLPPSIETKLPAQVGDTITIPHLHNRSVGENDYSKMILKIKTVSTNQEIMTVQSKGKDAVFSIPNENENEDKKQNKLKIGQFYKAQIAYVNKKGVVGYYSTVGVFKYTALPTLSITSNGKKLEAGVKNYVGSELIGRFEANEQDVAEKVYSYCFTLYEGDQELTSTGEVLHDSSADTDAKSSSDTYLLTRILDPLKHYFIKYKITTLNNLECSVVFSIAPGATAPNYYNYTVQAVSNYDIGAVSLSLEFRDTENVAGQFRLQRTSSIDNYTSIDTLSEFIISDTVSRYDLGYDFTVEQGVTYQYLVSQYDKSISTEAVASAPVFVDFEDMFLFDGKKQLKIKFNPKVSSFKNTILESKLDTLGGQFPFVFRNGRVKYKEIPLSGLISYWMDEEGLFMTEEELGFANETVRGVTPSGVNTWERQRSINLTGDNMAAERTFKLAVLEWLNNGEPKLLRSPAEGNYIVRLLNVSLSPDEKLGRMLHTFSATGYEIAAYNFSNLQQYELIGMAPSLTRGWYIESIVLENEGETVEIPESTWIRITGVPGAECNLRFTSQPQSKQIRLGLTGCYELSNYTDSVREVQLSIMSSIVDEDGNMSPQGVKIEYATKKPKNLHIKLANTSDTHITAVKVEEYAASFSGERRDIVQDLAREGASIDNILYLKAEIVDKTKSDGALTLKDAFGKSETVVLPNQMMKTGAKTASNLTSSQLLGRIEYSAKGKMLFTEIIPSDNVRVDIYYQLKTIEVSE